MRGVLLKKKVLWMILASGALLLPALLALTHYFDLPNPWKILQIASARPAQIGEVFPARMIAAAQHPQVWKRDWQPLSEQVLWYGQPISLTQFLQQTQTRALLVLHAGKLRYEWYAPGLDARTRFPSYSIAKSVLALLVGQAIAAGKLRETDRLADLLPELTHGLSNDQQKIYARITVQHLLDMQSGVAVSEVYDSKFSAIARMFITTDLLTFAQQYRTLSFLPGQQSSYRSVDPMLLGLVLERVTQQSLSALLHKGLWEPLGATEPATWNLDRPGGHEKAFCCINAVASDFARIGQLILNRGMVVNSNGSQQQVVQPAWVERLLTPQTQINGWGYSGYWWFPDISKDAARNPSVAIGIHGQYIMVDRMRRVVVVKLSEYGAEQDELETVRVLANLVPVP